jgi:hypothetical protein
MPRGAGVLAQLSRASCVYEPSGIHARILEVSMKSRNVPRPDRILAAAAALAAVVFAFAPPVHAAGPAGAPAVAAPSPEAGPGAPPPAPPAASGAEARKKKDKGGDGKDSGKPGEKDGKKDEPKEKPFDEVVKEFAVQEGLFTFYRKDDRTFMEIKPEQYGRFYLVSVTRLTGVGQADLLGNQMVGNFPVQFVKVGKGVQAVMKNVVFRSERDESLRRAVERSFSDSIAGAAKLESQPHPDRKSDLVDATALFVKDIERVEQYTDEVLKSGYKMDKDGSRVGTIKTFPTNVEVETVLHFANPRSNVFPVLPDNRSMLIRYNFSISAPPEDGYRPRLADDRIGSFITTVADYSTDATPTPAVRFVERWKLEKADPSSALSPPKEPITFHLDGSIPARYRDAVAQGALLWNRAFERIGFKDAVVVKPQPDDPNWDSADARYASIRWFVTTDSTFAIGPSLANPFTGQIYDADIGFSESMTRFGRHEHRELVDPLTALRGMVSEALEAVPPASRQFGLSGLGAGLLADPGRQCRIGGEAHRQAAFGWGLLEARGALRPGGAEEEAYVRDFLIAVTAHEVGHTLGLRHNYRASMLHKVPDLHDARKTTELGLTGSVMEYSPVNLARRGRPQGQYWQTTLGPYDYWAIEYAYKPIAASSPEEELPALRAIASRAAEPALAYATDEDAAGFTPIPAGMDPRNHQWDYGDDPIAYFTERVALARELWAALPGNVVKPGEGYQIVRRSFNHGISEYFPAVTSVTKYVGGVMHNRDHAGDPGGRRPYVPVPAAEQRRALRFLNAHLFAPDAFEFSPDLVNALAAERFGQLSGFVFMPRLDYPVHDLVLTLQDLALTRLYHPLLLGRVVDMDTKLGAGEDQVGMAEIFATLRDGIWSELPAAAPAGPGAAAAGMKAAKIEVNSYRRALQRRQLSHLTALALRQRAGAPEEAVTLARADLTEIEGRIEAALKAAGPGAGPATRAHLADSKALIEEALAASFLRSL